MVSLWIVDFTGNIGISRRCRREATAPEAIVTRRRRAMLKSKTIIFAALITALVSSQASAFSVGSGNGNGNGNGGAGFFNGNGNGNFNFGIGNGNANGNGNAGALNGNLNGNGNVGIL